VVEGTRPREMEVGIGAPKKTVAEGKKKQLRKTQPEERSWEIQTDEFGAGERRSTFAGQQKPFSAVAKSVYPVTKPNHDEEKGH